MSVSTLYYSAALTFAVFLAFGFALNN